MNIKKTNQLLLLLLTCFIFLFINNQTINANKTTVSNYYISISGKEFLKSLKSEYPKSYKKITKSEYKILNNQKNAVKLSEINSSFQMTLNSKIVTLIPKLSMISTSGAISDGLMNYNKLSNHWSAPVNFGTAFSVIYANDLKFPNRNMSVSYKSIPEHQSSYVVTSFK